MTDFKAKMHQIRFPAGAPPQTPLGSLQRSTRPPSWIWGPLRGRGRGGKGEGREGEVEGREREGAQVTVEPGPLRALLYATGGPSTCMCAAYLYVHGCCTADAD